MEIDPKEPSKKRISVSPAGRGWKARPEVVITPDYVRKLLEENRLTERDEALLRFLDGLPVISSRQVKRLFWSDSTWSNMQRRLRQLYDYHLLDRVRMLNKQEGITYTLGKAGRIWLHGAARGGSPPMVNISILAHDLAITEVIVLLTEELRRADPAGQLGLRLGWQGEALARIMVKDNILVEPDGLLQIIMDQNTWGAYLELDMGTERGDVFTAKLQRYEKAYWQVLRADPKSVRTIVVITIATERAANLAKGIKGYLDTRKEKPPLSWLICTLTDLQQRGFFFGARWHAVTGDQVAHGQWPAPWTVKPENEDHPSA